MKNLMLASSNQSRLVAWQNELSCFTSVESLKVKLISKNFSQLGVEILTEKPCVLLLDIDSIDLHEVQDISCLRSICSDTKTIILSSNISENLEWELIKAGVRGCCHSEADPQLLKQVVLNVQQGELWIRRTLASRFIDELSKSTSKNKTYRSTLGLLNKLTQREYDIAMRVVDGENNKSIARACVISEGTVKAHLTEIFQKLGVKDRLNLALSLVADNRNGKAEMDETNFSEPYIRAPKLVQKKLSLTLN